MPTDTPVKRPQVIVLGHDLSPAQVRAMREAKLISPGEAAWCAHVPESTWRWWEEPSDDETKRMPAAYVMLYCLYQGMYEELTPGRWQCVNGAVIESRYTGSQARKARDDIRMAARAAVRREWRLKNGKPEARRKPQAPRYPRPKPD